MTTNPPTPVPAGALLDEHDDHDDHDDSPLDRGLEFDMGTLLDRRRALGLLGGAGLLALAGCATTSTSAGTTSSASSGSSSTSSGSSSSTGASTAPTSEVPDETAGPFPGDGSNGANALDDSGVVRSDVTASFGSSTTKATGVPMTINLTVTDAANGYAAMPGAAVYVWHCNQAGQYSMYSSGLEDENYLRGVQPTNASGTATFTSIFPGAYDGRWPHIHFEVYQSTSDATSSGQIVKTSQIALPQATCEQVYATSGYEQSVSNLARTSLTGDMVFGNDGGIHQLASVTGSTTDGYAVNLTIGV